MSLRKFLAIGALAAAVSFGGAALAQTAAQKTLVDQAKAAGTVGEQADGFVGFRVSTSDAALRAAVEAMNAGRRAAYARSAADAGTSADVAGARMFESQLLPRIQSGQWYRNAQGQWVQR